jgi:hypothetical protein
VQLHNLQQSRVCVASCLGRCWCPWSCSRSGLFPLIGATDPPVLHADLQTARTPRKQHGRASCEDARRWLAADRDGLDFTPIY